MKFPLKLIGTFAAVRTTSVRVEKPPLPLTALTKLSSKKTFIPFSRAQAVNSWRPLAPPILAPTGP